MSSSAIISPRIIYPESDGKAVGESDIHRREILMIIDMLERFFRSIHMIYVSGNLMFYYKEGEPQSVVSPDVFVVKGIPKGLRRSYKLWEEQHIPCTVFEITSRSTRQEDRGKKQALYAQLGVHEYFMFDPLSEYLRPQFQGFTLAEKSYIAMLPDAHGALVSQELGLRMWPEHGMLRIQDIRSGERLLRSSEVEDRAIDAETRAFAIEQARDAAEERALEFEQARDAAEERANTLEAELTRLREELEHMRSQG